MNSLKINNMPELMASYELFITTETYQNVRQYEHIYTCK